MKVFRFHIWRIHGFRTRPYGYIVANWFERRAIRAMIRNGRTNIEERPNASGPKAYGATFIITAKRREK